MAPPDDENFPDLATLFEPRSVAVIGASDRPGNFGGDTVRRLVKFGFKGPVWPINRSLEPVAGLKAHARVADLPGVPDCVILAIPAAALTDTVRECAALGVRTGVAYAGGLAEAGGEGVALQRALTEACRETGFQLCGPNCVGIINATAPAPLTFATALHEVDRLIPGAISMVSQSGGIGTATFSAVQQAGFGFRLLISGGNEAVVSFADYLHALALDDATRVIAAYLEGLHHGGGKFVRALEQAKARGKHVVMIKAGATGASARAAQAHTGSLVGEDRVFDAILREFGVVRVGSVEELVDVCLTLAALPAGRAPAGRGVGIVTFGGGNGVLAADQCAQAGLSVPPLGPACVEKLRPLLVSVATASNPLDLTPTTAFRPESLAKLPAAMEVIADESGIDALLFIAGALASRGAEISDVVAGAAKRLAKPVICCWPAPPIGVPERLARDGLHTFVEPARAARALGRVLVAPAVPHPVAAPAASAVDWARLVPAGAGVVTEDRCHTILRAAGLPAAEGALAADEAGARRIAAEIGTPVALKGISPAVTHRAASGLLAVDLRGADEVGAAFRRLAERARELRVPLDGLYVQKMRGGGLELLVAGFRDPVFGPMVSVGAGGGLTELIDDVATARAPLDESGAATLLGSLRIMRRAAARDAAGAAAAFVAGFSRLVAAAPWPRFTFEINPIRCGADGAVAVDGLLIVEGG